MHRIFVSGIGTDVGKTIVSAMLAEALGADYWKPVQCGNLGENDSARVRKLVSNPDLKVHPERYRLQTPASPHLAASIDGVSMRLSDFSPPDTSNKLIIEGAGGLLVPLSDTEMMIDLIKQLAAPVVLVSRNYLGSINHTLLSIEALRTRGIKLLGVVFNGSRAVESEEAILKLGRVECMGRISEEVRMDRECIARYAKQFGVWFANHNLP